MNPKPYDHRLDQLNALKPDVKIDSFCGCHVTFLGAANYGEYKAFLNVACKAHYPKKNTKQQREMVDLARKLLPTILVGNHAATLVPDDYRLPSTDRVVDQIMLGVPWAPPLKPVMQIVPITTVKEGDADNELNGTVD